MDTEQLRHLIRSGESYTVEFKGEESKALNDRDLVEAAVCLANGQGGVLILGVEDDRRVTGARPRHGSTTDPLRVQALVANQTVPPVQVAVSMAHIDHATILL